MGLTALKRRCRALGIHRWPFRQVRVAPADTRFCMSGNAHAPREQLSSVAKMIDTVKKLADREDATPVQLAQIQVRRSGRRRVAPAKWPALTQCDPGCGRNSPPLTSCSGSMTSCG